MRSFSSALSNNCVRFRASVPNCLGQREAHSSQRRQTALAVATDHSEFKDARVQRAPGRRGCRSVLSINFAAASSSGVHRPSPAQNCFQFAQDYRNAARWRRGHSSCSARGSKVRWLSAVCCVAGPDVFLRRGMCEQSQWWKTIGT